MTEQAIKAIGVKPDRSEVLAVTAKSWLTARQTTAKASTRGGSRMRR
jgi:hypothetical protein